MLKIAVIDDDETEEKIWSILQNDYFPDSITVNVFQEIDRAMNKISTDHFDVVIVDNFIPPHKTAKFVLDALKGIQFDGRVLVFSNSDTADLESMLGCNVQAELFSKKQFMAIPQMRNFVENVLIGAGSISARALG